MKGSIAPQNIPPRPARLQGTDGIRGKIGHAEFAPIEEFLNNNILSPELTKLYCYSALNTLAKDCADSDKKVVVGRDPRDPEGLYLRATFEAIALAGFKALDAGILPTPGLVLACKDHSSRFGIMLTASHNPADQHGIKIFQDQLKLTPLMEEAITVALYHNAELGLGSAIVSATTISDATESFVRRLTEEAQKQSYPDSIVFDCANGASVQAVKQLLDTPALREKAEIVNGDWNAPINHHGGVGEIEGVASVSREDVFNESGRFYQFPLFSRLFSLADKSPRDDIGKIIGFSFDGDADRCFPVVYDPEGDQILILSGDQTAAFLMRSRPEEYNYPMFTVESDLNVSTASSVVGSKIHAVGDKWILRSMKNSLPPNARPIGFEDSGHFIFPSTDGFMSGNGIQAALYFLSALSDLDNSRRKPLIKQPFQSGLKETISIYWVDKTRINDQALRERLTKLVLNSITESELVHFADEPEMLFFSLKLDGKQASLFIRNSGTEDKTTLYARGDLNSSHTLRKQLNLLCVELLPYIKSKNRQEFTIQKEILRLVEQKVSAGDIRLFVKSKEPALLDAGGSRYTISSIQNHSYSYSIRQGN